jgi:hypothetical protein
MAQPGDGARGAAGAVDEDDQPAPEDDEQDAE